MDSAAAMRQCLSDNDPWLWAHYNGIRLQSGPFTPIGHEYQVEPMQSTSKKMVAMKGAQLGWTQLEIIRVLHGQIHGLYPSGVLYLFPTSDDVSDFAKSRFNPLIADNPGSIGQYIQSTDSTNIKRIGTGMLYLRGARSTQKIEGIKKDASKLRSIPVDKVVFDEVDLMDPDMVQMALERFSHSEVQEESYLSTPTIPDFGIDKLYQASDRRIWVIECQSCGRECCLELDFPECVKYDHKRAYRACVKCGEEIYPSDGRWVAQSPNADYAGYWISQLNSIYVDPGKILSLFNDPPNGNLQEVYNSKLGMAWIDAQNRLTRQDVYACCGSDGIARDSKRSCSMGADIGKVIHVVIGYPEGNKYRVLYVGRVGEFSDLHDLAIKFNVQRAVLDMEPETRKARDFQAAEKYKVYLCDYAENMKVGKKQDDQTGVVVVRRTEICDSTHNLFAKQVIILPRRSPEIEEYALEVSNIAKVLEEDQVSGSKKYTYRKLGADHYRHATNYFWLACQDPKVVADNRPDKVRGRKTNQAPEWSPFDDN